MKNTQILSGAAIAVATLALLLAGCGGTKVLKEPEPLVLNQPLASASDDRLSASLDWVIVRGGPGTWAKNADWDEYLIRVRNLGPDPVELSHIAVVDSLGTPVAPRADRKQLVKGAKDAKRRYKGEKIRVKAGAGTGALFTGAAVTAGAAAAVAGSAGILSSGGAAAATGGLILVPVLAVGGVFRGVNNSKVNRGIESRQTPLPIALAANEERSLDVFFPLTPSPHRIEVGYVDAGGTHTLVIDTQAKLDGLHLTDAD